MSKTIPELKKEITELKKQLLMARNSRDHYKLKYIEIHDWVTEKFNWFVDINAKGNQPALPYLIKSAKDILVRAKI